MMNFHCSSNGKNCTSKLSNSGVVLARPSAAMMTPSDHTWVGVGDGVSSGKNTLSDTTQQKHARRAKAFHRFQSQPTKFSRRGVNEAPSRHARSAQRPKGGSAGR